MALQQERQQRNTAYKVWIGDLYKGNLALDEQRFNFIEIGEKKIVRINVIANIIDKFEHNEKPFANITLDDSSGQIRAKTFDNPKSFGPFKIGNTILVVGTLRFFNEELYLLPEIMKHLDEKWLLVRKLELEKPLEEAAEFSIEAQSQAQDSEQEGRQADIKEQPSPEIETVKVEEEKIVDDSGNASLGIKSVLYGKINENPEGMDIDSLIMSVNFPVSEINTTISELIEEGKIYEPQPGKLRSI